jgi:hypothetical protein
LQPARHNFAIVFKSSDPEALLKVTRYISERISDSRVVFSTGPTDRFLWVLQQKERGVQGNGREL